MKKIALFILPLLVILSCQNSTEENSNLNSATVTDSPKPEEVVEEKDTLVSEPKDKDQKNKNEPVIDNPINVSSADFANLVLKSDKIVLVDFWAQWCGPCKMIAPTLKEIAKEYAGKVIVAKVDIDKNQELAMNYKIQNIPTLLIFKNGKDVEKLIGAYPKDSYVDMIKKVLSSR
jgi:thioredoxin 1